MQRLPQVAAAIEELKIQTTECVMCDVCHWIKFKAVNSCLSCRASYCHVHIQFHLESESLRRHMLVEPYGELQEKMQLGETLKDIHRKFQETQRRHEDVKKTVLLLKKTLSKVTEPMEEYEKEEISKAEQLVQDLEKEIGDLERRGLQLVEYSKSRGHFTFIQNFMSLSLQPGNGVSPNIIMNTDTQFHNFGAGISSVGQIWQNISSIGSNNVSSVLVPAPPRQEPESRMDFLQCCCQISLDPLSAHKILRVSEDKRKVTYKNVLSSLNLLQPDYAERFDCYEQVLCSEGLYGGCYYWEVEKCLGDVEIAVAYKGLSRKGWGHECRFGYNKGSWSLLCPLYSEYSATHYKMQTKVTGPHSDTIGVYLDCPAGTLSFYAVSETMTLLHRFETTFTEPLYPGFGFNSGSLIYSSILIC